MPMSWSTGNGGSFWYGPVMLGAMLIGLGLLLYAKPELLAYMIAGMFILAGAGLIATGWRMRRRVNYRRIDQQWEVRDPFDDSPAM